LVVFRFLFFSPFFRRSVAELFSEELSLSVLVSDSEEEDKADKLELSSVSQLRVGGGPGGLDDGLEVVVDDCLDRLGLRATFVDSLRAVGMLSGVRTVIHDFTELWIG
jgi:hypothetical protein